MAAPADTGCNKRCVAAALGQGKCGYWCRIQPWDQHPSMHTAVGMPSFPRVSSWLSLLLVVRCHPFCFLILVESPHTRGFFLLPLQGLPCFLWNLCANRKKNRVLINICSKWLKKCCGGFFITCLTEAAALKKCAVTSYCVHQTFILN